MIATREHIETFEVFADHLVRQVVPARGQPYVHRCPRAAFEQIAYAAEELGQAGFTLESLRRYECDAGRDVPFTNIAVAPAFLRDRGILDVRYRRNYAATASVHLDALTEYHALTDQA